MSGETSKIVKSVKSFIQKVRCLVQETRIISQFDHPGGLLSLFTALNFYQARNLGSAFSTQNCPIFATEIFCPKLFPTEIIHFNRKFPIEPMGVANSETVCPVWSLVMSSSTPQPHCFPKDPWAKVEVKNVGWKRRCMRDAEKVAQELLAENFRGSVCVFFAIHIFGNESSLINKRCKAQRAWKIQLLRCSWTPSACRRPQLLPRAGTIVPVSSMFCVDCNLTEMCCWQCNSTRKKNLSKIQAFFEGVFRWSIRIQDCWKMLLQRKERRHKCFWNGWWFIDQFYASLGPVVSKQLGLWIVGRDCELWTSTKESIQGSSGRSGKGCGPRPRRDWQRFRSQSGARKECHHQRGMSFRIAQLWC